MMYTQNYHSPLGDILLASDGENLTGLWFQGQRYFASTLPGDHEEKDVPAFAAVREWLDIYFSGRDPGFTPPLSFSATDFRKQVWDRLLMIPYGETVTYGEIAAQIARENGEPGMSAQAVGGAVGRNPIALIIPCHRVIGADGSLTGYAGGLERKQALLEMEREGIRSAEQKIKIPASGLFENQDGANAFEDSAFDVFEEMCRELHGLNE